MKRPLGITVISVFLGWEAIAGVAVAFLIFAGQFEPLHIFSGLLSGICGILAGVASVLIWKMRTSGLLFLRLWMACTMIFGVLFIISFRPGTWAGSGLAIAAFIGAAIGIIVFLDTYTRRHVGRAA